VNGCFITETLNVARLSDPVPSTTNVTICDKQLPYRWNGQDYTAEGTYTVTVLTPSGCDSLATLVLDVNPSFSVVEDVTVCARSYTLPDGRVVTATGTYISVVQSSANCDSTITTNLVLVNEPNLQVNNPDPVCEPGSIDLTATAVTAGSDPGLTYSYWTNSSATSPLANPTTVTTSGTYYIKATNDGGCFTIAPVDLVFTSQNPVFIVTNPVAVCAPATVDLTAPTVTVGSDPNLTYTYWIDSTISIPMTDPNAVGVSGTYYIQATSAGGCSFIEAVQVVVSVNEAGISIRYPTITATSGTPVQLSARNLGSNATYLWLPAVGLNRNDVRDPVFNYTQDTEYLISITVEGSCPVMDTLLVRLEPTGVIKSDIFVPKAWSPNNDGHNDRLYPLTVNIKELKYFRVFNRWGQLMFETKVIGQGWDGTFKSTPQVMDVYTWTLEAIGEDGTQFKRAGNSVLLR
jgi:gliding motility-associated-like protein